MKPIHLLAGLLAALFALLDLFAFDLVVGAGWGTSNRLPLVLVVGLSLGQLSLLAFWVVLAGRMWVARGAAVVLAAAWFAQPMGQITGVSRAEWFTLYCLFATAAGAVLLASRLVGVRTQVMSAGPLAPCPLPPCLPRQTKLTQYSLGSLLSSMTVVGVALGLSRHVAFPHEQWLAVASYGFWLVLVAVATLWLLLPRQGFCARLLGLTLLCFVAGWFMARTEMQQSVWFFSAIAFTEAFIISAGIAVIQSGCSVTAEA